MDITISPIQQQLDHWIEKYVPGKDLYFMKASDLAAYEYELSSGTLIFPRGEFFKHSSYNGIQMVNSYMYWMISQEAEFVIVAPPEWIDSLSANKRQALFKLQYELGRGLVGPLSLLSEQDLFPEDYMVEVNGEKLGFLQRGMWMKLPTSLKEEIVRKTAQQYDEWTSMNPPASMPTHLAKYANTFSTEPGANCLAATLFAISSEPSLEEWIIHEWIHGDTFMKKLTQASFTKVEDRFSAGDAVVWFDENNNVQHAAYCINGQLFFNKNGQTFFNPWKVVEWMELEEEWKRFTPHVYRRVL